MPGWNRQKNSAYAQQHSGTFDKNILKNKHIYLTEIIWLIVIKIKMIIKIDDIKKT